MILYDGPIIFFFFLTTHFLKNIFYEIKKKTKKSLPDRDINWIGPQGLEGSDLRDWKVIERKNWTKLSFSRRSQMKISPLVGGTEETINVI